MTPADPALTAAQAILSGPFTVEGIAGALQAQRSGRIPAMAARIARGLVAQFGEGRRPRLRAVAGWLAHSREFARFFRNVRLLPPPASMQPAAGAPAGWDLPALTSGEALAEWLRLDAAELQWLSAPWRGDAGAGGRLAHYRWRWIARRGRLPRLIEAPLPRLMGVQRRILRGILERIPPHPAAHGFVSGRGVLGMAREHTAQACVLRMDLADFFPSIRRARVLRVFLTAGYPEAVATVLADLCTTATPVAVCQRGLAGSPPQAAWAAGERLRGRHLPQGAPTSPALANLCAWSLDARLTGLAAKFGARYSRYADDLVFSGGPDFARSAGRCEMHAGAIVLEAGYAVAHRKTRCMAASVSQRALGLVLNDHPALPRKERDRLKAILTNCIRLGPDSQNTGAHADFRAHLQGRVAHAAHVHPASGARFAALFSAIRW